MQALTPIVERYLLDWGLAYLIGGGVFLCLGALLGWMLWKSAQRKTELLEERNRTAMADFERSCDEISRIKSELAAGED